MLRAKLSSGTYPGPASQTQNQGRHQRLLSGQGRKIGSGLESVFITSTDFADKATVERNITACLSEILVRLVLSSLLQTFI